ncbi:MAG: hypothetical protein LBP73_01695 [Clostridiales Family XIII bacterium]|jgi:hypothetical protein|nr:hypothetical protein [Clostridiales Family XIII bacterium]
MSQYTFSFINSEYERIPAELREELDALLAGAETDPAVTKLLGQICDCVTRAVADIAKYGKDQLRLP